MRLVRSLPALALLAGAGLVLAGSDVAAGGAPVALRAGGPVALSNTRENAAVFTAAALRPGRSAQGRVAIRNTGSQPARLALTQTDLQDALGPNGGRLSESLRLTVRDVGSARTVYAGPFGSMPRSDAGSLGPGQSRTFELTAHLPDRGRPLSPTGGDNAFQGSTASVRYVWTATESAAAQAPTRAPASACRPSLRVPVGQRLLRRRRMVARVRVSSSCRATVKAWVLTRGGRKRYLFGARNRPLESGRTYRVSLRLAPTVQRILLSRRQKSVRVSVRAGSTTISRRARVR
jgi:hypothetical protein